MATFGGRGGARGELPCSGVHQTPQRGGRLKLRFGSASNGDTGKLVGWFGYGVVGGRVEALALELPRGFAQNILKLYDTFSISYLALRVQRIEAKGNQVGSFLMFGW